MEATKPGNKHEFFDRVWETEFRALGYSEIQMRTERVNDIDFNEVDLTSEITTRYGLRTPIVGAAMSSISSPKMAIEMGKVGGGAFIHHSVDPEEQKKRVRDVKLHLNGRIDNPTLAHEEKIVGDVLTELENSDRDYRTLPIVDADGKFMGIVSGTHFDLFRQEANSLTMKDIMTPAEEVTTITYGSDQESDEEKHVRAYTAMREKKIKMLPVLNEDGTINSLYLSDGLMRVIHSNPDQYSLDKDGRFITFASVPANSEEALERLKKMEKYVDVVTIDTSHGENMRTVSALQALKEYAKTTKAIKENFADIDVIAGNISTGQTAEVLARYEPDAIKVGQGPGQICVSSDRLGTGTAQASAVYEVAEAVKRTGLDIPIWADGGIRDSADTVKALALGARAVMVGGLLAGTDEQPVPVMTDENGVNYKEYWGEGSERAQRISRAARQRYSDAEGTETDIIFAEGVVLRKPLKGPVSNVIPEHMMGARISIGSQGFQNIAELQKGVSLMRGN